MSDGITTGWEHALWLLGYAVGALLPLTLLVLFTFGAALTISVDLPHWVRVRRVRRQARRTGRTTG